MEAGKVWGGAAMAPLVVGITAHRNLVPGELDLLRQRVRELFTQLKRDFPHSPLTVLSPLAEGGDRLVAEEGLKLGAELIVPLPFARELYATDFAPGPARETFDALCAQARQVIELPLLAGHSHAAVAAAGLERNRQYAQVGVFVARHCHILLAIWDGKGSARRGGTAQIVNYFLTDQLPGDIERRRRREPSLYGGGDERLLWHLVCSRDQPDGAPAASLQPGDVVWRSPDAQPAPAAEMPPTFRAVFASADEFNTDAHTYAEAITREGYLIKDAPPRPGQREASSASSPAVLFRASDWLAGHFQRRVLLAMRVIYTIAFVMGVAFTAYGNAPNQNTLLYLFLLLFGIGALINAMAKRRSWQRKYLDYRALAEGLRVECHWRRAGISLTGESGAGLDNLSQKQDIELGWVRNVMRSAGLADDPSPVAPDLATLREVIEDWVGDDSHGELGYYRVRTGQRERAHRANEAIGKVGILVGIAISILLVIFARALSDDAKNNLMLVMAAFSIFAAVREAYSFRKADRELIRQYRLMKQVFGNARSALDQAEDADEQRRILRALGEASLAEHVEWAVMHRQRPLEAGKM